ncbi:hypothetical protein ABDJ41_06535 [Pedobacter sp. ASV1-7]|uniref:MutS-related protein n=1 Tax=Pedobacter sp. ASV1-7 TaxID=3145237 RepID=UPI0032E902A2
MNRFKIDEQTFKDLNVFNSGSTSNSIFSIFKNTRTMGARERLENMMQNPSSDIEELTLRRDSIAFFHQYNINLDIRNEEFDLISFYLKFDKRKSKHNIIDAVYDFLTRNSSNDYYIIKTGLKYLIRFSRYILKFIDEHSEKNPPEYIIIIFERITSLIKNGVLKEAILLKEDKLKFFQVNKLDQAIRGAELKNMRELLQLAYELDIFENIALLTSRIGLTFPIYDHAESLKVTIKGLFHPGISKAVKNDVFFHEDQNIVFLTGSNMAGKSSLLKSLGLVIYLSHLGFPVPAEDVRTTVFNGLITTINLPDDINNGLSHYYSEVKRVKEVANLIAERDRVFVIFDELFRGTNVKEAHDASLLIISELSSVRNSVFFISTHIVELADKLKCLKNISFKYLETFFKNNKPVFTYQLMEGISTETIGMYIVENEGIVDIIRKSLKK